MNKWSNWPRAIACVLFWVTLFAAIVSLLWWYPLVFCALAILAILFNVIAAVKKHMDKEDADKLEQEEYMKIWEEKRQRREATAKLLRDSTELLYQGKSDAK